MNTQPVEESQEMIPMSREEYIRQARESCLRNYYGDRMSSHDKAIEEYSKNRSGRVQTADTVQWTDEMSSIIVPYDEERFIQGRNRKTGSEGRLLPMNAARKLDANEINKRLQQENLETENEDLNLFEVSEPPEENIPKTGDIIRMSGIEDDSRQELNTDYIEEYKENYHKTEPENYVTSIRNVEPSEKCKKGQAVAKDTKNFRWFAIRCVCAFILLAGIIVWDKTAKDINNVSATNVYEKIVSSELASRIEEWFCLSTKK